MMNRNLIGVLTISLLLGGCGGGGSSSPTPGTSAANVSGDMLPLVAYKGWNYQGILQGSPVTFTLYVDPASGGVTPLVLLAVGGYQADATNGFFKSAAITVTGSASAGYDVTSFTLYDAQENVSAAGTLPSGSLLVPGSLTQGQVFTPYPGMSATVTSVGNVAGATACPAPAIGATVQYTFQGQTWNVSYVPGCGITQYIGNNGETFTLTSVGSYPQLGTLGNVRAMQALTMFDTFKSALRIVVQGHGFGFWHPSSTRR